MARIRKESGDDFVQCQLFHLHRDIESDRYDALEVHDDVLAKVESILPLFDGKYDSAACVDWEIALDREFNKHDFSNAQMIKAAINKFTMCAFFWWNNISNRPVTWDECKRMMRARFIRSYYTHALLEKLQHLKQGSRTVKEYYHEFKICILYGALKESREDTMSRFLRGLNSEIQAMLVHKTYNHTYMFLIACNIEKHIVQSMEEQYFASLSMNNLFRKLKTIRMNETR